MNYVRYDVAIVEAFHVKLVGWPNGMALASPSHLSTIEEVRRLRDALRSDACKWLHLTPRQLQEHAAHMKEIRDAPEGGVKKRKERSDKGKSRKKQGKDLAGAANQGGDEEDEENEENEDEEEVERPKKKKKSSKGKENAPPLHPSTAKKGSKRMANPSKSRLPPVYKSRSIVASSDDDNDNDDDGEGGDGEGGGCNQAGVA